MPKHTQPIVPADADLILPDRVTIALAELAGAAREGLLALAVGTGLGVLHSLLDTDVERPAGPKGRHNPTRAAVRHGTQPGKVTLGGRRVRVDRPRVRTADGAAELPLPTWQTFAATELLDQLTLERMLASSPPAATGSALSRSAPRWSRPRPGRPSQRSRAGSSPRPNGRWPSYWPPT